jgi:hypothetical protein
MCCPTQQAVPATIQLDPQEIRIILPATRLETRLGIPWLQRNVHLILWMGGTEEALSKRMAELRDRQFAGITLPQIHVWSKEGGLQRPPQIFWRAKERSSGVAAFFSRFPWYSKDTALFKTWLDLSVTSSSTDYPEGTMKAIRDYYQVLL